MARTPIIAGNWKMYKLQAEARAFCRSLPENARESRDPIVVVCPPFTALQVVAAELAGTQVLVGAQNCDYHKEGAYTGEVSPAMVADAGCQYVILGHSERRQYFAETDGGVNMKAHAALAHGLVPIICVGEKAEEREVQLTDNVVIIQVQRALLNLSPEQVSGLVFAYEPVWAIGTGKTCDAREANRVCGIIRETVERHAGPGPADDVRILYGGSVKPETIGEQMAQPHIDGALVGGASLDAASFGRIVDFRGARV
ncbi:MAG: triose-phosphate isomerase [Candidatus Sericytochromatia bacterium]|nr:triose-phosphate isomerase [Candidatus Tanganyikabacteria bacterium]